MNINIAILVLLGAAAGLLAQESPSPVEAASPTPEQTSSTSPSASTARNVPLRFVPPPMEGTISLGIFDSNDKLVRVLHRESKIDNFTIDENALKTTWDGKNDAGEDLLPGKYRARGYMVAKLKVEDLGKAESLPGDASDHISVKLVTNPLSNDTRVIIEITAGFDDKGTFLETMDHLPLATIRSFSNMWRIKMAKNGEKTVDVWLDEEQNEMPNSEHLRVSNIDKMMAFDCGFFELR
ncbi:MAG TPA: hypothetical protein VNW72_05935 [Chthoniobacterales bacterium]|jgi:hypothetical protein|nr:hypothetical protein [Chthoniobacterales bacterium]